MRVMLGRVASGNRRTTESVFPSSWLTETRKAARDKHAAVAPACFALTKSQCSDNNTLDSTH
jgi:hypothetical protein